MQSSEESGSESSDEAVSLPEVDWGREDAPKPVHQESDREQRAADVEQRPLDWA